MKIEQTGCSEGFRLTSWNDTATSASGDWLFSLVPTLFSVEDRSQYLSYLRAYIYHQCQVLC